MIKAVGAVFSFLSGLVNLFNRAQDRKAGAQAQQLQDSEDTNAALQKELAVANNPSNVADRLRDGTL